MKILHNTANDQTIEQKERILNAKFWEPQIEDFFLKS